METFTRITKLECLRTLMLSPMYLRIYSVRERLELLKECYATWNHISPHHLR